MVVRRPVDYNWRPVVQDQSVSAIDEARLSLPVAF